MVGAQELAALDAGGPRLAADLASVERHRGVLAYLVGRHEIALDYFSRALERERSADNLANVLAALAALDALDSARELLASIRAAYPQTIVERLQSLIEADDDLRLLREEILT